MPPYGTDGELSYRTGAFLRWREMDRACRPPAPLQGPGSWLTSASRSQVDWIIPLAGMGREVTERKEVGPFPNCKVLYKCGVTLAHPVNVLSLWS